MLATSETKKKKHSKNGSIKRSKVKKMTSISTIDSEDKNKTIFVTKTNEPSLNHTNNKIIERKQESSEEIIEIIKNNNSNNKKKKKKNKSKKHKDKSLESLLETVKKEIGPQDYQIISLLGVGSQGRVYLVRLNSTNQLFAMKVFSKDRVCSNTKTTISVLTEQRFLSTTNHPFITKLYHSFQSYERLFMVMEYCAGGELWTTIKKQPGKKLTEDQVRFYASEVLLVLEYVHFRGYIYRDLKPENILLQTDGHIRVADFGLSKQSDEVPQVKLIERKLKKKHIFSRQKTVLEMVREEVVRTSSLVGSVHYLAPEVLQVNGSYDVMADWWAFGVLLYDMFYGYPPFQGESNEEVITKIVQCDYEFPKYIPISSVLKDLIKSLLKVDPKKRLAFKRGSNELKEHPFFEKINFNLLRQYEPPIIPPLENLYDVSNFELYEGDEDSTEFEYFSQIPESPCALSPLEQKNFESFPYFSESLSHTLADRLLASNPEFGAKKPKLKVRANTVSGVNKESRKSKSKEKAKKKKKSKRKSVYPDATEVKTNAGEIQDSNNDLQFRNKTAKHKPARKLSATFS